MSTILQMCESYKASREALGFFDVNCWWDPAFFTGFSQFDDFDQYYASLKQRGVGRAVITAAECISYETVSGNETMCELIADKDDLYGAMVLTPDHVITGEDIAAYIQRMVERKVVVARVFPKTNRHSMKEYVMGDILRTLSDRRIPLMLWHSEVGWDTVDAICAEYPELPVIIEGNDVKLLYHNRHYIPLFKKHSNLYLETHNVILFNEMDFFAGLGATRLIFGSYQPYNTPDAAMAQVIMGEFDGQAKELIAHGNLERLIAAVR